jgi:hypothetical protein
VGKSTRRVVAALIAGIVLGSTAVAGAMSAYSYEGKGIACSTSHGPGIVCVRNDAKGYGVGFSRDMVIVQTAGGRTVFKKYQPSGY